MAHAVAATGGLQRSMKVLGTVLITLSSSTPASSVFIIVPGILLASGSGAFLSMLLAAFVGLCMAFVYAELSSAFPVAGGEYSIIGRVMGPRAGFIVMGVYGVSCILIPAVLALGISEYLGALNTNLPQIPAAMLTVALTTLICILNIRTNAVLTGVFLVVEILALVVLVALGFWHVSRPLSDLILHPVMLNGAGLVTTPIGVIGMATAVAIFAYNGFGAAVNFSEEMHEPERHVARAILWALAITVITELLPVTAVLMSAPDLRTFLGARNMFGEFIRIQGGPALHTAISLGIALAIFNATIAVLLLAARVTFSTGRDQVWPRPLSDALRSIHSRFRSPWVATLLCGVLAALACLVSENLLLVITGAGLILVYSSLCVAVIIGRWRGATAHGYYRMPLFPLAPVAALVVMLYVVYTSWLDPVIGRPSLFTTLGIMILSAAYYTLVLRRRGVWVLRGPEDS
jgi:amino acid transporter